MLQVGCEPKLNGSGAPVMEPLMVAKLDDDGKPVVGELGRPVMVQTTDPDGLPIEVQATRPLFRLGDFMDRLQALADLDEQRRRRSKSA